MRKISLSAAFLFAVMLPGFFARGEYTPHEKQPASPLFEVGSSYRYQSFFQARGVRIPLHELKGGISEAHVTQGEFFEVSMYIKKVMGEKHPCPLGEEVKCEFAIDFVGFDGRVWPERLQFIDVGVYGGGFVFRAEGAIPVDAPSGKSALVMLVRVPTLRAPVFSYRIPITVAIE